MRKGIVRDLAIIFLSVCIAIIFSQTGILEHLITSTKEIKVLGSFIAGILFASVFTAAPATVALAEIAQSNHLIITAVLGGLGALVGDLLIFRFVKDGLSEDIVEFIRTKRPAGFGITKFRAFKWLFPVLGAIIIASPLPDEVGIAMLGFSKIKSSVFIPLSFVLNSAGIYIIGLIARAV